MKKYIFIFGLVIYIIVFSQSFIYASSIDSLKLDKKQSFSIEYDPEVQYINLKRGYPYYNHDYLNYQHHTFRVGSFISKTTIIGLSYEYDRLRSSKIVRNDIFGIGVYAKQIICTIKNLPSKYKLVSKLNISFFCQSNLTYYNGYTDNPNTLKLYSEKLNIKTISFRFGFDLKIYRNIDFKLSTVKEYYLNTLGTLKIEPLHPYFGFQYNIYRKK